MDNSNAAGGGLSYSSFLPPPSLPMQPADYDDFECENPLSTFEFDPFPSSSYSYSNPFSPATHAQTYSSATPTPPPPAPPIPSSHSADPSAPLFDDSESALFSTFLTTLDVDNAFLFNPVLPPGIPSPPSAFMYREGDGRAGEALRFSVGDLSLRRGRGRGRGSDEDSERREVKYEDDDDEDVDGGLQLGRSRSANTKKMAHGAAEGEEPSGGWRGKKARVGPDGDTPLDPDVEMGTAGEESSATASATTSATATRRRLARSTTVTARVPPRHLSTVRNRASSTAPSTAVIPLPHRVPSPSAAHDRFSPAVSASPDPEAEDSPSSTTTADAKKAPLTESQKRSNHILSEQKRRNAIRSGFKDLVDLLGAGEAASGITIAIPTDAGMLGEDEGGKKKKGKGSGRGRGRKGEVGAGASKSVVLEKAAAYILWLERGNDGLEEEVRRVEMLLAEAKLGSA